MRATLDNATRAGFAKHVHAERRELADLPAAPAPRGLVAANPPYGERLGEADALKGVYALLGEKLKAGYVGWQAAVLTGNPPLGRELLIKAKRTHTMFNGPIECRLLRFDIEPKHFEEKRVRGALPPADAAARARPGAAMFGNRLRKNAASLGDVGAQGRHRVLSRLRRRHAGVRVLDRPLRRVRRAVGAALRLRAGVRAAGDDRRGRRRARAARKRSA